MVLGRVYCILIGDDWYIGSTVTSLSGRLKQHILKSKKCPQRKVYAKALEIGWDECIIELLEEIEIENLRELTAIENTYIDLSNDNCLNSRPSFLTIEQQQETTKKYNSMYTKTHVEQIREQQRNYKLINADRIKEYKQQNRSRINELRRIRRANKRAELNSQL